jgi:hypothetical protein
MFHDLRDGQSIVDVSVKHLSDQVDAVLRKRKERHAEGMVKDLVDVIERVLFVNDGVKQDSEGPNILFFTAVGFTLENFRCSIV